AFTNFRIVHEATGEILVNTAVRHHRPRVVVLQIVSEADEPLVELDVIQPTLEEPARLSIQAAIHDPLDDEVLEVTLKGLPAGGTLSDLSHSFVVDHPGQLISITDWDLGNLTFALPSLSTVQFIVTVSATATEPGALASHTVERFATIQFVIESPISPSVIDILTGVKATIVQHVGEGTPGVAWQNFGGNGLPGILNGGLPGPGGPVGWQPLGRTPYGAPGKPPSTPGQTPDEVPGNSGQDGQGDAGDAENAENELASEETVVPIDDTSEVDASEPSTEQLAVGPPVEGNNGHSGMAEEATSLLDGDSEEDASAARIAQGSAEAYGSDEGEAEADRVAALDYIVSGNVRVPAIFSAGQLWSEMDAIADDVIHSTEMNEVIVGSAVVVATGFSAAQVLWMLRGGVLLTKLMSALPMWIDFDPLPILDANTARAAGNRRLGESLADIAGRTT
ncbi:MAG: hypothetical protein KDA60_20675, partial [Planctomycetales bacterium]|nr:hypothetical protein [Planctomycetales bacterium]